MKENNAATVKPQTKTVKAFFSKVTHRDVRVKGGGYGNLGPGNIQR